MQLKSMCSELLLLQDLSQLAFTRNLAYKAEKVEILIN